MILLGIVAQRILPLVADVTKFADGKNVLQLPSHRLDALFHIVLVQIHSGLPVDSLRSRHGGSIFRVMYATMTRQFS